MLDAIHLPYRGRSPGHSERERSKRAPGSMASAPIKSTPIQIPQKRRPVVVPGGAQPMSPDMIFEMSPVTSDFPLHSSPHTSTAKHTSRTDSFVYSIPVVPSPKKPEPRLRRSPLGFDYDYVDCDISPDDVDTNSTVKHPSSRRGHCTLDEYDLSPETPGRHPNTTRVTGFLPIKGDRCDTQQDQNRPLQRLSPGPRRGSYNASPWILPGKGKGSDDELGSSMADTSPFEFERSLLRRIENQNRPRFAGLRSYHP